MRITGKYLTTLVLALLTFTSAAQTDTISKINIRKYRQVFWDSLPQPIGWTNDFEGLFSDQEERSLDSIISAFKGKTTIEIAIVTLDTMVVSKESFDELTLHIAKTWGIGLKEKDNGILIGISRGYRKMRIQNANGIQKMISDKETKEIIDKYFIPSFKKGEYYEGTLKGLTGLIELLNTKQ